MDCRFDQIILYHILIMKILSIISAELFYIQFFDDIFVFIKNIYSKALMYGTKELNFKALYKYFFYWRKCR